MNRYIKRLNELLENEDLHTIASFMGMKNTNIIYEWLRERSHPNLKSLIKLANYFECSLDYLCGRTEDNSKYVAEQTTPFDIRLKQILKAKDITQYRLIKEKIMSKGNAYDWFHDKSNPSLESILKLADYLNVSIDHLVGRE